MNHSQANIPPVLAIVTQQPVEPGAKKMMVIVIQDCCPESITFISEPDNMLGCGWVGKNSLHERLDRRKRLVAWHEHLWAVQKPAFLVDMKFFYKPSQFGL